MSMNIEMESVCDRYHTDNLKIGDLVYVDPGYSTGSSYLVIDIRFDKKLTSTTGVINALNLSVFFLNTEQTFTWRGLPGWQLGVIYREGKALS